MGRPSKRGMPEAKNETIFSQKKDLVFAEAEKTKKSKLDSEPAFIGNPIPAVEAIQRWPLHYKSKDCLPENAKGESSKEVVDALQAKCHYKQAIVDGIVYNLCDDANVKVRWNGYGPSEDTWEPIDGLSDCEDKLKEFVIEGFRSNILPLPGNADFICGGPPCQGISGFNRFRNAENPLDDPKNHQLMVYMGIVEFLKPKYVLMENVVDILKFSKGFLGRYALGRLVSMNYQARLGMMAAVSYGLPQFRMRVFLWGSHPLESLPQYPLPTHEAVVIGGIPNEFEDIAVAYEEIRPNQLEKALHLGDAISDLPAVTNVEDQNEKNYGTSANTEFQKYIRLKRNGFTTATTKNGSCKQVLYDHKPLKLNTDDFERGANFRDLPGVLVGANNKVELDQSMEREKLPSGKPLVTDYAITFVGGTSPKPFGRLCWDAVVATVVTRAEPHNQIIIHPEQDQVPTIRENARLQGFPDCYQLQGYIQVGNAVAVPVALALGYTFGLACQRLSDDNPLTTLPLSFPKCLDLSASIQEEANSD